MNSALDIDARLGGRRQVPFAPLADRYSIVGKLRSTGRAEVSIGLPGGAQSPDELVVIKAYGFVPTDSSRVADDAEVPPELEVASTPRHDNLVRVFECGREAGRHFIVSEYLEGTTLRRLLRWLAPRGEKLPNAAVVRILIGMFAAVEHANHWARTSQARALVHQPIDATDLFITYAGAVKVLGFKPPRARDAVEGRPAAEPAAVDELLSTQRSPELASVLAKIGNRVSSTSLIGLWQVARMLKDWQHSELRSDGRAELAEVMASVQPEGRATRRAQLAAAVARVMRAREAEPGADASPVSGYRVAASGEAAAIIRAAPMRQPEVVLPALGETRGYSEVPRSGHEALVVHGPEVVSHLQRRPLLPPPIPTPPAPRRRAMPWPSLVLLAGALAAGLAFARHRDTRREATAPVPPSAAAPPLTEREPEAAATTWPGSESPEGESPAGASPAGASPAGASPAGASLGSASPTAASPSPAADRSVPAPIEPHAVEPRTIESRGMQRLSSRDAVPKASSAAPTPALSASSSPPARRGAREARFGGASIARAPAAVAAPGYLTLDTTPWSNVSAGGVSLGQTPLVKVELAPGPHLLELANEELGIATSVLVDITSGGTTVRRIGLERPIHAARR